MLDSPHSYNIADFRKRYRNSYGFLLNKDDHTQKKTLVYISDVEDNKVVFNTVSSTGFYAHTGTGIVFEFLPITRGWHWSKSLDKAFLFSRIPATQWTRGISQSNTNAASVLSDAFTGTQRISPGKLSLAILHDVFLDKTKPTWEEFYGQKTKAFIINKFFYIHEDVVYFLSLSIGEYDSKTSTISLMNGLVRQELTDAIRRELLPIKVQMNGND